MNSKTALAFAIAALESLPTLIKLSVEAAKWINDTISTLRVFQAEGRDPTDAEWEAFNERIEELRAQRVDPDEDVDS